MALRGRVWDAERRPVFIFKKRRKNRYSDDLNTTTVCVDDIKTMDVERLEQLLAMAPKFSGGLHEWLSKSEITEPVWDDYMEYDQDFCLGLATILKEVIEEAEGIQMTACDNYDSVSYLLYQPSYPWNLMEQERNLTEQRIAEIISRYVRILTSEPIDIDYQSVDNGG